MSEIILEKPTCGVCCDCGAIYFETLQRSVSRQKRGAVFICPGDDNDGNVYTQVATANLGVASPPDCGSEVSFSVGGGFVPYAVGGNVYEVLRWEPRFGDSTSPGAMIGAPSTMSTIVGVGSGDLLQHTFTEKVTASDLFADAAAAVASATEVPSFGVPTDVLDWDVFYEPPARNAMIYSQSRFKWRHAPPMMTTEGRIRGTCWKAVFEFIKVPPDILITPIEVVDAFTYEWDGTLPGGFDPEDPSTYPGQFSDWITMPALTLDDLGSVMTLRVTVNCRCDG